MTLIQLSPFERARIKFRDSFKKGIKPVDGRQPIPDEIAMAMIQELNVPKDALIGVYDAFLILSTHLKEQGYTNIVVLENTYRNLTSAQEHYYNKVKTVCEKSNIKYYTPPRNNYNRCDMNFDVIIGNPPYQSDKGGGNKRGSANSPLWLKLVNQSFTLLKKDGFLSLITPINIVNGGDMLTRDFLGNNRKYNMTYLDFSTDNSFDVGIPICRWIVQNSLTQDNNVIVNDGRVIDTTKVTKISEDCMFDSIVNSLVSFPNSLGFNTKKAFHYSTVENNLKKNDQPKEWARDLKTSSDDVYKYPININGKIKYSRVKVMDGCWRVFVPQMQVPTQITVDFDTVPATSTFNVIVSSYEEGVKIKEIIDDPRYQWVINNTRVSGRISPIIGKFANAPIDEVLTSDQLSYIQSQL